MEKKDEKFRPENNYVSVGLCVCVFVSCFCGEMYVSVSVYLRVWLCLCMVDGLFLYVHEFVLGCMRLCNIYGYVRGCAFLLVMVYVFCVHICFCVLTYVSVLV